MQIHEIFLYTPSPKKLETFYCDLLGFERTSSTPQAFSFRAGKSIIHFSEKEDIPIYHYAFNIPENQPLEALSWLKKRTAIILNGEAEIIDFDNWNAHAIYFADPAGNIVEFIARHDLPNASEAAFSIKSVINLSEIGMVSPDAPASYNKLRELIGVQPYRQHTDRFAAMGDENGLFIVVPNNRNWFPTEVPSEVADFRVIGSHGGNVFSLSYSRSGIFAT